MGVNILIFDFESFQSTKGSSTWIISYYSLKLRSGIIKILYKYFVIYRNIEVSVTKIPRM